MRAVVLGGAGDMGSAVVQRLAARGRFQEVVVADIRTEAAERLAASLGFPCLRVQRVDAEEPSSVQVTVQDADVVVNCIGPFYRFCSKVLKAVIDAGVNYVDICDDYDGTADALKLNGEARQRGVTAITGLGWTPGLSNILAKAGSDRLESVDTVNIAWVGTAADSKGLAIIEHVLNAISGKVPTFRDGSLIEVESRSETEQITFPEPIGKVRCYHVGHPEPLTIPQHISGVKTVTLKGALIPPWVNTLGSFLVHARLTRTAWRKRKLAKLLHSIEGVFRGGAQPVSAVRVNVRGILGDESTQRAYAAVGPMALLTAAPAALGAEWVAEGRIRRPGVSPPEACVDNAPFLQALQEAGIELTELPLGA